jgi:hypothetical protein
MEAHTLNPGTVIITLDVLGDSFESEIVSRFSENKFRGFQLETQAENKACMHMIASK